MSAWYEGHLIYPDQGTGPPSNPDLPEDVRADYLEAQSIANKSPRGAAALLRLAIQKLCKQLGEPGENINADIASLVKKGLHVRVQQALDVVRVIGNNAVHPGQIDLKDDRETAAALFDLVNLVPDHDQRAQGRAGDIRQAPAVRARCDHQAGSGQALTSAPGPGCSFSPSGAPRWSGGIMPFPAIRGGALPRPPSPASCCTDQSRAFPDLPGSRRDSPGQGATLSTTHMVIADQGFACATRCRMPAEPMMAPTDRPYPWSACGRTPSAPPTVSTSPPLRVARRRVAFDLVSSRYGNQAAPGRTPFPTRPISAYRFVLRTVG